MSGKISQKIGLIGCGNMGSAILESAFKNRICRSQQVWVADKLSAKVRAFAKIHKCHGAEDAAEVVRKADIILLAVKPQDLKETAQAIRPFLNSSKTVISILAGVKLSGLKQQLGPTVLVRAMPNLGARVGASITAVYSESVRALKVASALFSACGRTVVLKESFFDTVTAVSGSGPAYFFLMMEQLESFAIRSGIPAHAARELAVQTALGAGLLASASKDAPGVLREKVTSKKGTTDAALSVLKSNGFDALFQQALAAAKKRSHELSQ